MTQDDKTRSGLLNALGAYLAWGFVPLYFHLLRAVPALELVGWRIVWTLPLCIAIVAFRGQGPDVRLALRTPATLLRLVLSALLIGANWVLYVWAVNSGHVLAASLGYYINPLLNVLLGTLFLGERLNRVQWTAVGIATAGISLLAWGAIDMLAVAIVLGASFALYGLVRKLTVVGAVPGLTIETTLLYLPALIVVAVFAREPGGSAMARDAATGALLAGVGVITAVPMLMFAVAARRLDLSTLGFIQFLSPTIGFVLGVVVYDEPLGGVRLPCFVLIWLAIGLFSADMLRQRARRQAQRPAPV